MDYKESSVFKEFIQSYRLKDAVEEDDLSRISIVGMITSFEKKFVDKMCALEDMFAESKDTKLQNDYDINRVKNREYIAYNIAESLESRTNETYDIAGSEIDNLSEAILQNVFRLSLIHISEPTRPY